MEALSKFKGVNFPTIIIKHMYKVMTAKDDKLGLASRFWLSMVFAYFEVPCRPKDGSVKLIFTMSTLEDNECIPSEVV